MSEIGSIRWLATHVAVLVQGYAIPLLDGWRASSSVVLARTSVGWHLFDPGINRTALLRGLAAVGVRPREIATVCLTHYHLDHAYLAALFPRASVVDLTFEYRRDRMQEHLGQIADGAIRVLATPGHCPEHCSFFVLPHTIDDEPVIVAGDVFWWPQDVPQCVDLDAPDPLATDQAALVASRRHVLEVGRGGWIVPGHGAPFRSEGGTVKQPAPPAPPGGFV